MNEVDGDTCSGGCAGVVRLGGCVTWQLVWTLEMDTLLVLVMN